MSPKPKIPRFEVDCQITFFERFKNFVQDAILKTHLQKNFENNC